MTETSFGYEPSQESIQYPKDFIEVFELRNITDESLRAQIFEARNWDKQELIKIFHNFFNNQYLSSKDVCLNALEVGKSKVVARSDMATQYYDLFIDIVTKVSDGTYAAKHVVSLLEKQKSTFTRSFTE